MAAAATPVGRPIIASTTTLATIATHERSR
jgi:hypothetical protein